VSAALLGPGDIMMYKTDKISDPDSSQLSGLKDRGKQQIPHDLRDKAGGEYSRPTPRASTGLWWASSA
jgi:hypothetical protein